MKHFLTEGITVLLSTSIRQSVPWTAIVQPGKGEVWPIDQVKMKGLIYLNNKMLLLKKRKPIVVSLLSRKGVIL